MNRATVPRLLSIAGFAVCTFAAGLLLSLGSVQSPTSLVGAGALLVMGLLVALLGGLFGPPAASASDASDVLQVARGRARAISAMANTLGATLDYHKVLEAAANVGVLGLRKETESARLISMVLLFEGDQLRVATSRRLTHRDATLTVPGRAGVLAQALEQAEPVFASDCVDDPELGYFVAFQEAKSVMVIPLRASYQNYGLLVFGSTEPDAFSDEHAEFLAALGTQATIALQNAVLYEDLREEKERIVQAEENARKKLARDLHDGPTQSVSAIAMRVNYIRGLLRGQHEAATSELEKVEELARRTTTEIRHMLFTLRPLVLETQGLAAALEQLREKMKDTHNLDIRLEIQAGVCDLIESSAQGVLFYIIEEAVNNARKHAQAKNIFVRIYQDEPYANIEIQDDGVGFDLAAVGSNYDQRGSLGMVNMHERAALIESVLSLESAPGKGTKITVQVPTIRRTDTDAGWAHTLKRSGADQTTPRFSGLRSSTR